MLSSWMKITPNDVCEQILKLANEGITLSQITPEIPEVLYHLIKKAVVIRKHLECNRSDKDSKFR
ncbi:6981_t:CDS:2, partial [Dentiscutata heterogama]